MSYIASLLQGVKNVFQKLPLNLTYFENRGDNLQSPRLTQIRVQAGDAPPAAPWSAAKVGLTG